MLRSLTVAFFVVGSASFGAPALAEESAGPLQVLVLTSCPSGLQEASLQSLAGAMVLEVAATKVIETVVDAASAYLTAAAQTKTASLKGDYRDTFYTLQKDGKFVLTRSKGCLVLFKPGTAPLAPWFGRVRKYAAELSSHETSPQFYFEAQFERPTPESTHLQLQPRFLHVSEFLESNWASKNDRTYAIAITMRNLEDGNPFATTTFTFKDIRPGTRAARQVLDSDGKEIADLSIKSDLASASAPSSIPLMPRTAEMVAAINASQIAIAPFKKAIRIANQTPSDPDLPEPEALLTSQSANGTHQKFNNALQAYCSSLNKLLKDKTPGALPDARCPVAHLHAVNDLELVRTEVQRQMEKDWAQRFLQLHSDDCQNLIQPLNCVPHGAKDIPLGPFSWEVAVVETREPIKLVKVAAETLAAKKEALKTELADELIPSKRAEAKQKADAAKRDAVVAYKVAMLDVEKAEAKLAEAAAQPRSLQVPLEIELLKAKVSANSAARAAGEAEPFNI